MKLHERIQKEAQNYVEAHGLPASATQSIADAMLMGATIGCDHFANEAETPKTQTSLVACADEDL